MNENDYKFCKKRFKQFNGKVTIDQLEKECRTHRAFSKGRDNIPMGTMHQAALDIGLIVKVNRRA